MGESSTTDLSSIDHRAETSARHAPLARYLGEIVSAASVLTLGERQLSPLRCRRRPKRRRCAGRIEVGRDPTTDAIVWRCSVCGDGGKITNWRNSRWDLGPELKNGQIVSLSQVRAQRALRNKAAATGPARVYEIMAELVEGPVPIEQMVMRKLRLSGEKTLHELHRLLAEAYERDPEDPYEFMFGALYEADARRFSGVGDPLSEEPACETQHLHLDALGLQHGQSFGYLCDFDAEWVHRLTVLSIEKGGRGAEIVESVGLSPSAEEEEWFGEFIWEELDDECPLTELYGPYDGNEAPDSDVWDAMEELEQLLLVLEGHVHSLPDDHPPVESMLLHALAHQIAESALLRGDLEATRHFKTAKRRSSCRHLAIHEVGRHLILELL